MKTFFKFYFWLIVIVSVVVTILAFGEGEPLSYSDYFDFLFSLITLLAILGYAYSKKILSALFWKCYLPIIIAWDSYFIYDLAINDQEIYTENFGIWFLIFIIYIVLAVPCLLYTSPSPRDLSTSRMPSSA